MVDVFAANFTLYNPRHSIEGKIIKIMFDIANMPYTEFDIEDENSPLPNGMYGKYISLLPF